MNTDQTTLKIYTDGACKGNPGPGGWGALLDYEGKIKEINAETDVILTGGFSKLISPKLAFPHFLNPNLTLNGIQIIYRENQ